MEEPKPQKVKRPYEKTPARMAASRAALEKAQAALKAQGYKRTPKRDASNLNNLAKANAARRGEAARLAADLEVAFPDPHGRGEGEGREVLEKVGRTILRRWGSVRRGMRRERRQVMGLLTWAAGRAAPASLEDKVLRNASLRLITRWSAGRPPNRGLGDGTWRRDQHRS